MSSTYRAICVSHVPALVLDDCEPSTPNEIVAAVRDGIPEHKHCEVIVGRWSGSLISLACPNHAWDPDWVDDAFIRLAALASRTAVTGSAARRTVLAKLPRCWTPERLASLDAFFVIEDGLDDDA